MKNRYAFVAGMLGLIALIGVSFNSIGSSQRADISSAENNNLYQKVMRDGVIRAAFITYPPAAMKNLKTGEIEGIFPQVLEKAASNLGLKVEWVEETGWGTMIEGLKTGRFDLVSSPVWNNAARAAQADFSEPLYYSLVFPYVNTTNQTIKTLNDIDQPGVTIATIDGEAASAIVKEQFPRAKAISLPSTAQVSDVLLYVSTGKAQVALVEPYLAKEFLQSNPDSIKKVELETPLRAFPNSYLLPQNETAFSRMFNIALKELILSGEAERIIKKYEAFPDSFFLPASPYSLGN